MAFEQLWGLLVRGIGVTFEGEWVVFERSRGGF